jgi:hypothetical protein
MRLMMTTPSELAPPSGCLAIIVAQHSVIRHYFCRNGAGDGSAHNCDIVLSVPRH